MNVYVDKPPKNCSECPCRSSDDYGIIRTCQLENDDGLYLVLTDEMWGKKRPALCPLKTLDDFCKENNLNIKEEKLKDDK